jgi:tRNA pseudouridine55 synthase
MNKPRGMTSFGVVACLRRITGIRRIGHLGTLDPFADGLLPLAVGLATAVIRFLEDYTKTYEMNVEFGRTTDTMDITGSTLSQTPPDQADRQRLLDSSFNCLYQAVAALPGEHLQTPPMYSAVKVGGRPLYYYARKGMTVERSARPIHIYRAEVVSASLGDTLLARLRIHCSKGTYLRTIADELGRELGYGAVATSLTRLQCGPFQLSAAQSLADLQLLAEKIDDKSSLVRAMADQGILLPVARALVGLTELDLAESDAERLICGQKVYLAPELACLAAISVDRDKSQPVRINSRGRLIAVARLVQSEPGQCQVKTERVLMNLADFRQA